MSAPPGTLAEPNRAGAQDFSASLRAGLRTLLRYAAMLALALALFALVLLLFGKDPLRAYTDILRTTLGSTYGLTEVIVKMIPLILCACAVLLPARIGLVNVGGEGQLYMGAWLATFGALTFTGLPQFLGVPLVLVLGFIGGGLWALIPAVLRAKGWLNEVISTLLLNYIAVLFVSYFVFGPWRDRASANFPQTAPFVDAMRLPQFADSRIHLGLLLAAAAVVLIYLVLRYSVWGYAMRAIGGSPTASRRSGLPLTRYTLLVMFVGGGLAGLAGVGEVMAIEGRLRPGFSASYGYIGFLISWLANHNPLGVVVMSFLMAVLSYGGDTLQITQGLPFATVNIIMALILFVVLGKFFVPKGGR
jgi:simple sugar transport system permease protein